MYSSGIKRNKEKKVERKTTKEFLQQEKTNKKKYDLRDYDHVKASNRRAKHDYLHSQQFQDDLRSMLLEAFKGLIVIQPTKSDCEQLQPLDLTPTEKARPEESKKLILDEFGSWCTPPLKQAEKEEEIESKPIISLQQLHLDDQLKQEEGLSLICDQFSVQNKAEVGVFDGSPKALGLVLSTVEQGDSFKSLSCEFLIRPIVCLQLSLVEHLRVVKGLQQVVFEPGGSLCVFKQSHNILEQKSEAFNLDLQSSFTLEKQDLWSNLFEGREDGVILSICSKNRGETGGNTPFISPITDQNKLRRKLQKLVVVKEKPELEDEYGDKTTRPPDQKKDKLRVHGLMFMCRTCVASSRRDADSFKLNKVKEPSTLVTTCTEKNYKQFLLHEEGLQYFVFDPGGSLLMLSLLHGEQDMVELDLLQGSDLRTNPFKGGGDGAAMSRGNGELSESDEGELIEPDQGDKGAAEWTNLREELEVVDPEENLSRGEPSRVESGVHQTLSDMTSFWNGPVTQSRLKAQEESLIHLAKNVEAKPEGERRKPACWFNLISM